jgi:hypothetical protein
MYFRNNIAGKKIKMTIEKQITEEESISVLNSLLVGAELLELIDKVKGTILYRQSLKQKINLLLPELEKHCDHLSLVLGIDDQTMFTLMEKKELMVELATLRPEYKLGFCEIVKMFKQAPQLTLHRLGIKFEDKDGQ